MLPWQATHRLRVLFATGTVVILACVFTKVVAIATDGLPLFSWGRTRWVVFAVIGYCYYRWLKGRVRAALVNYDYPTSYAKPAREAAVSIAVVPLGLFVGRNVFAVIYPWDPFLGALIGGFLSTFACWLFSNPDGAAWAGTRTPSVTVQRGAELTRAEWAIEAARRLPQDPSVPPFYWAGAWLPAYTEAPGALVGSPGTAKTRLMRQTMATILPHFTAGQDLKGVVFDPKGDFLSECERLGVTCPVFVMNPYDARATPWAVAKDVTPARADQVAAALIPDRKHDSNPFFFLAARGLASATFTALASQRPGAWTLRDVVHLMADYGRLQRFLRSCPATRDRIRQLNITKKSLANVMQEVNNAVNLLRPVAALWDSAPEGAKPISLTEWVRDKGNPSLLVLGLRRSKAENCQAVNRLMFGVLADTILDEPETKKRSRFWFFIDELGDAGKLVGLNDLMRLGRSRGARFILSFQNLPGLKAHFADEKVDEITGLIGNLTVLHVDCPTTAEWASRRIGDAEVLAEFTNTGSGTSQSSKDSTWSWNESINQSLLTRRAVLQGELLHLGAARPDATVDGYHMLREVNAVYRATLKFSFHDGDPEEDFRPRDDADVELREWEAGDAARLGMGAPKDERADGDDEDDGPSPAGEGGETLVPDDSLRSGPRTEAAKEPTKKAEDLLSRLKRIKRMDV